MTERGVNVYDNCNSTATCDEVLKGGNSAGVCRLNITKTHDLVLQYMLRAII